MEPVCPHCGSSDLARYVRSGMGRSVKDTRRRIDTGCLDNGCAYYCWSCNNDIDQLKIGSLNIDDTSSSELDSEDIDLTLVETIS